MSNWISADTLPQLNKISGESDQQLCYDEDIFSTFVAFYSTESKGWILSHFNTDNRVVDVTHYKSLPDPPNVHSQSEIDAWDNSMDN